MAKFLDLTMSDGAAVRAYVAPPPAGVGPGLILVHGAGGLSTDFCALCDFYAEDGYAVLAVDLQRHAGAASLRDAVNDVSAARAALAPYLEAAAKTGAVGFGRGALIAGTLGAMGTVDAVVGFGTALAAEEAALWRTLACPTALHLAGAEAKIAAAAARLRSAERPRLRVHEYADCRENFFDPRHADHDKHARTVAHTRSLAVLRPTLGPHYDLSSLLQEHLKYEFVTHDADATMETMVAQPYVNHVPTLTGGVGHDMLKRFYKYHFIPHLPEKHRSVLISETVGSDAVILELVNIFTHDVEIDYLLPGIPPSGKELTVPIVVVAKFRGGQLYHEHIYWDQATLLAQLGLIDRKGLPIAGAEEARKMLDQSLPANELMPSWRTSAGKPI
jgi:carboxymethylenebutenolidase